MNLIRLTPIAVAFACGLMAPHAAAATSDAPKPSWQMVSVSGNYETGEGEARRKLRKTVNFFLDGTSGQGEACLIAPRQVCVSFGVGQPGPVEPGRYRLSSLAGQDSEPGAAVAVLDTLTGHVHDASCAFHRTASVTGHAPGSGEGPSHY